MAGVNGKAWMWSVRLEKSGESEVWQGIWEGFMRQEAGWEVFAGGGSED